MNATHIRTSITLTIAAILTLIATLATTNQPGAHAIDLPYCDPGQHPEIGVCIERPADPDPDPSDPGPSDPPEGRPNYIRPGAPGEPSVRIDPSDIEPAGSDWTPTDCGPGMRQDIGGECEPEYTEPAPSWPPYGEDLPTCEPGQHPEIGVCVERPDGDTAEAPAGDDGGDADGGDGGEPDSDDPDPEEEPEDEADDGNHEADDGDDDLADVCG